MRTTLKRGIGRGATVNGNGRAILPPGPYTPVRVYRMPPPQRGGLRVAGKIVSWLLAVVVLFAGAIAGGAYLFFHHSVAAVAPHTKADKKATEQLAGAVDPSKPAVALVIGYDRRYGETGHSRSDTIMLVRTQPNPPAISILSFPRDLAVDITCPGQDLGANKINAAYAFCGSPGSMSTIRALTGLPINYLVTVNFRGFTQVVDKLGGIWIDVDRRYYHSNDNTSPGSIDRYSEINLFPGYQKLNGAQALAFVRYRHTDDDIYRNARQQLFLKAVRQQIGKASITDMPRILHAIVSNLVVGRKGGGAPSEDTIFNYAQWLYGLPKGNIFQVKLTGLTNGYSDSLGSVVNYDSTAMAAAIRDFQHPDVAAPEKAASVALHKNIGKDKAPSPPQTTVSVLNANGVAGSAGLAVDGLDKIGYRILFPQNDTPADAPPGTCPRVHCFYTKVFWNPAKKHSKPAARRIAALFGQADVVQLPKEMKPLTNGSMVIVAVGTTFHGSLAPAPVDHTPPKQPPSVVFDASATRGLLTKAQHKVPFKLEVPTLLATGSAPDTGTDAMPIRTYKIDGDNRAVRLTFTYQSGGYTEYWGVEETDWDGAPVLNDGNFDNKIKGRQYRFFWNGPDLHMIALYENGATYWVTNTLLDSLSPQTMIAIAKGLKPLGAVKK
ncbi:MAG: LCP family protein [Actinobacteria bacterium]|nr:LCP family protein [Actinomycetota bacterium]